VHDVREDNGNYAFHVYTLQIRVSFPVSTNFIWSQVTGRGPRNSSKCTQSVDIPRCDLPSEFLVVRNRRK